MMQNKYHYDLGGPGFRVRVKISHLVIPKSLNAMGVMYFSIVSYLSNAK